MSGFTEYNPSFPNIKWQGGSKSSSEKWARDQFNGEQAMRDTNNLFADIDRIKNLTPDPWEKEDEKKDFIKKVCCRNCLRSYTVYSYLDTLIPICSEKCQKEYDKKEKEKIDKELLRYYLKSKK